MTWAMEEKTKSVLKAQFICATIYLTKWSREKIMTDVVKQEKKKGLSTNMWMYALGAMGISLSIGLINSYQAEFFDKMLGANLMIFAGTPPTIA